MNSMKYILVLKIIPYKGIYFSMTGMHPPHSLGPIQSVYSTPKLEYPTVFVTPNLGGGNSNIFHFHPDPWGNDPIFLDNILQMGSNHQPVSFFSLFGGFFGRTLSYSLQWFNDGSTVASWKFFLKTQRFFKLASTKCFCIEMHITISSTVKFVRQKLWAKNGSDFRKKIWPQTYICQPIRLRYP